MTPEEYQMLLAQQQQQAAAGVGDPTNQYKVVPGRGILVSSDNNLAKATANNAGLIAGSIASGAPMRSSDGKGWVNPMDAVRQQAAQGTPIGMLYGNAAGQAREDAILGAGVGDEDRYRTGNAALQSGFTANSAFKRTNDALGTLAKSGATNLSTGATNANSAAAVAKGMNQDIYGLRQAAAGEVPSAAQIQQRQGISDAINSQASLAAGARGGNLAAAMRGAQAAGAGIQARGVADAAALRANEMATARGQLTQATGTQGQLYGQAGAIQNALAQSAIGRANMGVTGAGNVGSATLSSQMQGNNGFANGAQLEQGRVGASVAQDRQDQNDLNNYLLQLSNQGLGIAAQNYGTDTAAGVRTREQNLQLLGAAASGVGSTLAGFGTR